VELDWSADCGPSWMRTEHGCLRKFRAPFVLCHLEGLTNEEAARQLGCPKGTILSRLARARARSGRVWPARASARLRLADTLFLEKTMAGRCRPVSFMPH